MTTAIKILLAQLDKLPDSPDSNMQATEAYYLDKMAGKSISSCVFKPDDDSYYKPKDRQGGKKVVFQV